MLDQKQNKPDSLKKIVFFIDKDKYETDQETLTARQILIDFAKLDPEKKTLVLKEGNNTHEYSSDDSITMKNGMHFTLFDKEPTTTS